MKTAEFNEGWRFKSGDDIDETSVRLPHDAMIGEPRSADASTGNHGGYFPGGVYHYSKQWRVPDDAGEREYRLFFEGVYGDTVVKVDDSEIARCNSGYRAFYAPLGHCTPGAMVTIEVLVDNSKTPNARWYSGSGIHRPVWLESRNPVHIADDGIHLVTRSLKPDAILDISIRVEGRSENCKAYLVLGDASGTVASVALDVVDGLATGELKVSSAQPWSAENPYLYDVSVQLLDDGTVVDERSLRTGLRTIDVDAERGLRINGQPALLRGACVHSDNGLLGAITLPAAEYRRARILKESGFNAIRASHNPFQRSFLDACDELGLYVIDELTDVWFKHKTPHDNAEQFASVWRDDARAMIAADRNRPSVIMYSIGNEISETSSKKGVDVTRGIHHFFRHLDSSRPTTIAINMLLNMMASKATARAEKSGDVLPEHTSGAPSEKTAATSTAANLLTAKLGKLMGLMARLPAADRASRDVFSQVDVAGNNYAYGRYNSDRQKYPERVILGTESMPGDLPSIWQRVTSVPGVIGDFMWTGWDYLGEAGIGSWSYGEEPGGLSKPYPALLAGCGAIDITGLPGAPIFLAKAVWGFLDAPAIAVRPLIYMGKRANRTPWRSTDAISSWAWSGASGKAQVEVYSSDEEVELLLNGRSFGRKRAGMKAGFVTRFKVPYEPGELVAVGYRGGRETGRSSLRSAHAELGLNLRPEKTTFTGPDDLIYIWLELSDEAGTVESMASDQLSVSVEGPAELIGLGNAAPITEEGYTGTTCTTYFGRAQAVLRGTSKPGEVTVLVSSEKHGEAKVSLSAR